LKTAATCVTCGTTTSFATSVPLFKVTNADTTDTMILICKGASSGHGDAL